MSVRQEVWTPDQTQSILIMIMIGEVQWIWRLMTQKKWEFIRAVKTEFNPVLRKMYMSIVFLFLSFYLSWYLKAIYNRYCFVPDKIFEYMKARTQITCVYYLFCSATCVQDYLPSTPQQAYHTHWVDTVIYEHPSSNTHSSTY